jgi:hypothetical protein
MYVVSQNSQLMPAENAKQDLPLYSFCIEFLIGSKYAEGKIKKQSLGLKEQNRFREVAAAIFECFLRLL